MIQNLYSTNQEGRRLTKGQILTIAKESEMNRVKIGGELTALLSQSKTPAATWYDVADLLVELRATEAIGELVRQLDYHNGPLLHLPKRPSRVVESNSFLTDNPFQVAKSRSHVSRKRVVPWCSTWPSWSG